MDVDHLKSWIGRTEEVADVATAAPLTGLAALLDHDLSPWRPDELPPLAHWLYFLPRARQSEIGEDGHARRGGFLPPVRLPRRMWAGSRIEFRAPIPLGATIKRRSTVQSVQAKTGASGEMVFVTVRHEITVERKSALVEEQDIVYREAPRPEASPASTAKLELPGEHGQSEWTRRIAPDPVQLFRYSALTFNGHRIHYDRDYAREVEGYPGLVVHGPYLATLLVDHFLRRHPGSPVTLLRFRARRPLFDGETLELCGVKNPDGAGLWVRSPTGEIAMDMAITTVRHAVPLSNA